ncbi:hypothetical protein DIE14_20615 [Burkholderia sp. Bp9017]|uniref:hypothetical protein n=1 Tax=Burkholderia TaxID=32008 RepID=UPI000F5FA6B3|nr:MULTISPECIES: hypothetical protein [Burkholderia]RQZ24711.1 hypothetical protein DIE14_20615 [Burkholderia sp. Bp9017]RQZ32683.1 hypothetical protein DIE13_20180 [Burkholderia sp. Bp9016]
MKVVIWTLISVAMLAGCDDKNASVEAKQAAAAAQLRDGSNIVSPPPKNWTWGDAPSQPSKKDQ